MMHAKSIRSLKTFPINESYFRFFFQPKFLGYKWNICMSVYLLLRKK